jgi:hypothetical protein
MRNACKILLRNPEERTPIRIPMHRLEDNIRMDIREKCGKV